MDTPPPMPSQFDYQPPQPKEGLSTGAKWGIGCSVGCLVTLLIAGVIGYFVYVQAKEIGTRLLNEYTSETPIVFTAPEAEPGTIEELVGRFDTFRDAMKTGGEAQPLLLTGEEINLLIHHHPDWQDLAGHTAIEIEGNQMTGQMSLPLGDLGGFFEGRYLNGIATIRLAIANGVLEGYFDAIEVAGQPVPPEIISELQKENIFKDAQSDPQFRDLMKTIESLEIQDGQLIIVPKPAADRAPGATQAPAVERMLREGGWQATRTVADYAGIPRVVTARRASELQSR